MFTPEKSPAGPWARRHPTAGERPGSCPFRHYEFAFPKDEVDLPARAREGATEVGSVLGIPAPPASACVWDGDRDRRNRLRRLRARTRRCRDPRPLRISAEPGLCSWQLPRKSPASPERGDDPNSPPQGFPGTGESWPRRRPPLPPAELALSRCASGCARRELDGSVAAGAFSRRRQQTRGWNLRWLAPDFVRWSTSCDFAWRGSGTKVER
jgi:hypothetical protein